MQYQDGPVRTGVRGRPASAPAAPAAGAPLVPQLPEPAEPSGPPMPGGPRRRWQERCGAIRNHPWMSDILVVAMVIAVTVGGAIAPSQKPHVPGAPNGLNLTIAVLSCLALLRRRQHPLIVLALTELAQLAYLVADGRDGSILLPTLIALYTVASREGLRRGLWIASAVAVAHTVIRLAVLASAFVRPENYLSVVWLYLPVAVGEAVRAKRAYWAEVQARLARADREREEEAARRVTAERMRIARELHDVVAHSIAMINIQAGVAAHVIEQDVGQARQALVHIKEASRDALAELRTTLGVLRQDGESDHPTEPMPGADGIESLVASYRTAGLPVQLEIAGAPRPLPAPVGLALYRIVQESLTNAVKHAGPGAQAAVRIRYVPHEVDVEVADDGRGASAGPGTGTGHGLLGMRERATAVGGTLRAGPGADRGYLVAARLPTGGAPSSSAAAPAAPSASASGADAPASSAAAATEGNTWSGS
jgi:signal transduction histidine kinase